MNNVSMPNNPLLYCVCRVCLLDSRAISTDDWDKATKSGEREARDAV